MQQVACTGSGRCVPQHTGGGQAHWALRPGVLPCACSKQLSPRQSCLWLWRGVAVACCQPPASPLHVTTHCQPIL